MREQVIQAISDMLDVPTDAILPNSHIEDDLGGDSLDRIELLMELEGQTGLEIDDEIATKWQTVQDVVDYIEGTK